MKIFRRSSLICCSFIFCVVACKESKQASSNTTQENRETKRIIQGIWLDEETEDVTFWMKGDSILYADSTIQPAYFKILGDTMMVYGGQLTKYPLKKCSANNLWIVNPNGDCLKLMKSSEISDSIWFKRKSVQPVLVNEKMKHDTVVSYQDNRYHCYTTINPTKYKVIRSTFNDDGILMDNVYYDNIVHLSVFQGSSKVFSKNITKQMFSRFVSEQTIEQVILGDVSFAKADAKGLHFDVQLFHPEGNSVDYLLSLAVDYDGQLSLGFKE